MPFELKPAPHITPPTSVPLVMRRVLYALTPAAVAHTWYFGWGLFINLAIAVSAALAAEALVLRFRRRAIRPGIADLSAVVTAVLLAFALPPLAPWWLPALGAASAIVLAKHLYGGLGSNLFNPAMVGYVILLISFPIEMTQWLTPAELTPAADRLGFWAQLSYTVTGQLPFDLSLDALTQATPLDQIKEGLGEMRTLNEIQIGPLFGAYGGHGWEWINGWIALGGFYLLYRGVIRWHIPVSLLAAMLSFAMFMHAVDPSRYASPGFHLFSGAALLGAFFIATDPVTAAGTNRGRLIYGAAIGILTYAIRTWGSYPEGLAFAVLLMNAAVPLLDRYTRPRIYGRS
jgi:electron transport complex protein RnfD